MLQWLTAKTATNVLIELWPLLITAGICQWISFVYSWQMPCRSTGPAISSDDCILSQCSKRRMACYHILRIIDNSIIVCAPMVGWLAPLPTIYLWHILCLAQHNAYLMWTWKYAQGEIPFTKVGSHGYSPEWSHCKIRHFLNKQLLHGRYNKSLLSWNA